MPIWRLRCSWPSQCRSRSGSRATRRTGPLLSLLGLLATLPLAFRCRYPLATYVVVWLSVFGIVNLAPGFDDESVIFVVAFVFALYSFGANARGRQAWAAAVVIPVAITAFVTDDGDPFHYGDIIFGTLIIAGPWLAGVMMRIRRQERERSLTLRTVELERAQDERARAAVVEERARIARELHDVVAHAISVVVVQSRGGRKVLDRDPEAARTRVRLDRAHGRAGPRRDAAAARNAARRRRRRAVTSAAAVARAARGARRRDARLGLPVELEVEGDPNGIPPGVDVSGVPDRAGGADERAQARWADGRARRRALLVRRASRSTSSTTAAAGSTAPGTGNGLLGIRERVAVVGGEVQAGPRRRRRIRRPCPPAVRGRTVIRVLIADDQSLVRTGFRLILSGRAGDRGRRRGARRRRGGSTRGRPRTGRRAHGRAHARGRRHRGDASDRRRRDEPTRPRADDVRPRRHRLRRAPRRRERLPAQGCARGAAPDRDPGRCRGRIALRAVGDAAADRRVLAPRPGGSHRRRSPS